MENELLKVAKGIDLTEEEMLNIMNKIMDGKLNELEIANFLTNLKNKGESVEEISAGAKVMRAKAEKIKVRKDLYTVDTCGTGGDGLNTFNISTTVAFVLASEGIAIVKHGNRSVSSKSGSADVLETLGVNINLSPKKVEECVNKIGIGFLFAPTFHKAMKNVAKVRRSLAFRTIFNLLGPLTNPASAKAQILGVFNEELTEIFASVLNNLGTERALIAHGLDGLDEITISDKTKITELNKGEITTYFIEPEDFGLKRSSTLEIEGGDSKENAEILKGLLNGEIQGAKRDILILNSGAGLYIGNKANSLKEGVQLAREILDSGKAYKKLEELIAFSNEVDKIDIG